MAKVSSITEHYQHFLRESKEGFWGDLYGPTQLAWKGFFELQSERERDRYSGAGRYERQAEERRDYCNGYYERDFLTRFGSIRLRIAHAAEEFPAARTGAIPAAQMLVPTECVPMAHAICLGFCAAREKVSLPGKGFCRICIAAE